MRFPFWIGILVLGAACSTLPNGGPAETPAPITTPTLYPTFTLTPTPAPPPSAAFTPSPTLTATLIPADLPRFQHVLLVSVDGLRPDALLQAETPNLDALWIDGVHSWSAQTVLPSVTLPAHASLLSGQPPQVHGIQWNDWQPERGFIQVPTILSIANQADLEVGLIAGKRKLEHLAPPGSVDYFAYPASDADTLAQAAARYLVEARPNLLVVHFPDVDEAGHRSGWMSPAQLGAVVQVDTAIGRLREALAQASMLDQTLIIVTADHGGSLFGHGSDSPEDVTIPWIAQGPGLRPGYAIQAPLSIMDTAPTVLYALGLPLPEGWAGRAVVEIFTAVESPAPLAGVASLASAQPVEAHEP